jgi:hypothetical protein
MSDTPLTDEEVELAKKYPATSHGLWVSAEFARDLERQLNEYKRANAALITTVEVALRDAEIRQSLSPQEERSDG